jgi:XTP/dITP diphosphohydrolase
MNGETVTIYAATTNAGKLAEFVHCAAGRGVQVVALPGLHEMPEPVEDAATFMGNAELKAVAYSRLAPGRMVMADDSGLEVDALGGQPGVRSARFADDLGFEVGNGAKDARNNRAVLSLLAQLPPAMTSRTARFVCALAVACDGVIIARAEGEVEGELLDAPRGKDGFGYDPLFLVPSLGLTLAETTREQKWAVSHRGLAFRRLLGALPGTQKADADSLRE